MHRLSLKVGEKMHLIESRHPCCASSVCWKHTSTSIWKRCKETKQGKIVNWKFQKPWWIHARNLGSLTLDSDKGVDMHWKRAFPKDSKHLRDAHIGRRYLIASDRVDKFGVMIRSQLCWSEYFNRSQFNDAQYYVQQTKSVNLCQYRNWVQKRKTERPKLS